MFLDGSLALQPIDLSAYDSAVRQRKYLRNARSFITHRLPNFSSVPCT